MHVCLFSVNESDKRELICITVLHDRTDVGYKQSHLTLFLTFPIRNSKKGYLDSSWFV